MIKNMPVSEVRKKLPRLIKKLQKNRGDVVRITIHGNVQAELRSSATMAPTLNPGKALLKAFEQTSSPTISYPSGHSVAIEHDDYLF